MSKLKLGLLFGVYLVIGMQVKGSDSCSSEPTGLWHAMRDLSWTNKFYTLASIVTGQEWLMPEEGSPVNVTGLSTSDSSLQASVNQKAILDMQKHRKDVQKDKANRLQILPRGKKRRAMGTTNLKFKYQTNDKVKKVEMWEEILEVDESDSELE